jgi:broad specificity phosphatase PhoE
MREADCALSPRGCRQAELLGTLFSTGSIIPKRTWNNWHIYSSPMKRCLLTSQEVSKGLDDKTVTVFPFLYESHGCYKYDENENYIVEKGLSKVDIEVRFQYDTNIIYLRHHA